MLPQPMFTRMCQQWLHVNVFPNTLCAKRSPCQGIPSFAAIVISALLLLFFDAFVLSYLSSFRQLYFVSRTKQVLGLMKWVDE